MTLAATATPVRVAEPEGVVGDVGEYDDGWFCIRTESWPCPATGCPFVATYLTAAHLIVVFPSVDDRDLLTQARNARDAGRNPRVIEYEPDFGPAVSWDQWVARGCPVHAYSGHTGKDGYDRL